MTTQADGRFDGRVAVVTGGAGGIGAATVARLAREGARVFAIDVVEDRAQALAEELRGIGLALEGIGADVTDPQELRRAFEAIAREAASIDVLVNVAGGSKEGLVSELSASDWDRLFALNMRSAALACNLALPSMRGRDGGAIVNMASISGLHGDPGWSAYNAMKAAIVNFTQSLAWEVGHAGIRVNAVAPGPIASRRMLGTIDDSEAAAFARACALGRMGRPEEVAAAISFLASDDASFITGTTLVVDGGLTARTGQPTRFTSEVQ